MNEMSNERHGLNRRKFLRGMGAAVSLPALEAFRPAMAAGAGKIAATTASGAPLRMAYLYIPNGVNVSQWRPKGVGADYEMGATFGPMKDHRKDFQVFTGFEHRNASAGRDGAGDHARSNATFLTGRRAKKTAGSDIQLGISVDQVAANAVSSFTRLPSIELSSDGVRKSGSCDSGYSCAYQFNLSWRSETQPMTPENNPRAVFERLFGAGSAKERQESFARRFASKKSMLDFIQHDARSLHRHLGRNDQQKLDEYLTGVREIEVQIEKVESMGLPPDPGVPAPKGIPGDYGEHMRLMMDMMVLAFMTDSTRIASYLLAHDGSNRNFKAAGVSEGHHSISHHKGNKDNLAKIAKIDKYYMEQFAYFVDKMKNTEDVDGKSLLHNSMVVYGGAISDGNAHSHDDLPIIVAGQAGGKFKSGGHVHLGGKVPLSNLYVRMLNELGVESERFGDSTGALKKI